MLLYIFFHEINFFFLNWIYTFAIDEHFIKNDHLMIFVRHYRYLPKDGYNPFILFVVKVKVNTVL